jgi:hypothetical protein
MPSDQYGIGRKLQCLFLTLSNAFAALSFPTIENSIVEQDACASSFVVAVPVVNGGGCVRR